MKYANREGEIFEEKNSQERFLNKLYTTMAGQAGLKILTRPWVSKLGGAFLGSPFSKCMIRKFIETNQIDMDQYEQVPYRSYNDFFTRKIKHGKRPLPEDPYILFSPCDCKVSVYPLEENGSFTVKDTEYTATSLLKSRKIAKYFEGGYAVILRLTVDDYHRYCYIDDGEKSDNFFIPGIYHTVNPIANDYVKIYKENAREFTMMKTEHFGKVVQVEVGALMVGRIQNHHEAGPMARGAEKGYFEFGGSTIVLLLEKNRVKIREELLERSKDQCETKVLQGDPLGRAIERRK